MALSYLLYSMSTTAELISRVASGRRFVFSRIRLAASLQYAVAIGNSRRAQPSFDLTELHLTNHRHEPPLTCRTACPVDMSTPLPP